MRSTNTQPDNAGLGAKTDGLVDQKRALGGLRREQRWRRASEDPASRIASENLRAVYEALETESRALDRAETAVRSADAALSEIGDLLVRAESILSTAPGERSDEQREAAQSEIDSILSSVDAIASTTLYEGEGLLDGSGSLTVGEATLEIGSAMTIDLGAVEIAGETRRLAETGFGGALSLTGADAELAGEVVRSAIAQVADHRRRIETFTESALAGERERVASARENILAADSAMRDADELSSSRRQSSMMADSSRAALTVNEDSTNEIMSLLLG